MKDIIIQMEVFKMGITKLERLTRTLTTKGGAACAALLREYTEEDSRIPFLPVCSLLLSIVAPHKIYAPAPFFEITKALHTLGYNYIYCTDTRRFYGVDDMQYVNISVDIPEDIVSTYLLDMFEAEYVPHNAIIHTAINRVYDSNNEELIAVIEEMECNENDN